MSVPKGCFVKKRNFIAGLESTVSPESKWNKQLRHLRGFEGTVSLQEEQRAQKGVWGVEWGLLVHCV